MKKIDEWHETKYVKNRKGHWKGSKNPEELTVSSRLIVSMVIQWYEKNIPLHIRGKLLDLGCGKAPLFGIYQTYASDVCLVDWGNSIHENHHLDLECNLNEPLPFPNDSFDSIILSDVLEHIAEPTLLLSEMYRILRTNGKILMNIPFYYPIHEPPYEYFRYTRFMLQKFADSANLKVLELSSAGGQLNALADIMAKTLVNIPLVGNMASIILQNIAHCLLKRFLYNPTTNYPLAYFVILQKEQLL